MPQKRRANDDDEVDCHAGHCAMGSISQLKEQNPPGVPFDTKPGPIGFLPLDRHGRVIVKKQRCRKR